MHSKPTKCFITDLETFDYINPCGKGFNCIKYKIILNGIDIPMMFSSIPNSWVNRETIIGNDNIEKLIENVIRPYKEVLCGLIYNNKFQIGENILTIEFIKKIISESTYPKTKEEKLDNLFLKLNDLQSYDGEEINLINQIYKNDLWKSLYFKNVLEFNFYINTLIEEGLIINPRKIILEKDGKYINVCLTYKGLLYFTELKEKGKKSNKCFVAMSFDKEEDDIYSYAIEPACNKTGFDAKRIDKENYKPELTINDAIISLIKECKFCIADFTRQREGVYFEAGYALGRGLDVIYTCRKDYFDKSHFDTNHFPHIIYNDNDELKKALIDKINVRIKV